MSLKVTDEKWEEMLRRCREDGPDDVIDWPETEMDGRFYDPHFFDQNGAANGNGHKKAPARQ